MFEFISDLWSQGVLGIIVLFLFLLMALLILGLVAIGADWVFGHNEKLEVIVMEKTYSPSSSSSGLVTGVTSNGSIGTGIVSTTSSEKFILIVKDAAGEVFSTEVEPKCYVSANKGDRIIITIRIGGFSKARYT